MHIGFTGTQKGMTPRQCFELQTQFNQHLEWLWLHHGDCIGADTEAHDLAQRNGLAIIIHPPEIETKRAFNPTKFGTHLPKPYLDRNHDIVDASDVLIAAPEGPETLRSGTWATVRYARSINRPIIILEP